jgi:hypothetical protein
MRSLLSSSRGTGRLGASPRRRMWVIHSMASAVALFILATARTHNKNPHTCEEVVKCRFCRYTMRGCSQQTLSFKDLSILASARRQFKGFKE